MGQSRAKHALETAADEIKCRAFIVGCPRSGTTLLQGILAQHPLIMSFPEMHFFPRAFGLHIIKKKLSWPALNVNGLLEKFLIEIDREDLRPHAKIGLFTRDFHQPYLNILDILTLEADKSIWVEKTPRNLHFIPEIMSRVSKAKFIHIIRSGPDVVSSLYQVTHTHPEYWYGKWSIDKCIQRWNKDILISQQWHKHPNHLAIRYEHLTSNPEHTIKIICNFLNISYHPRMLNPPIKIRQIVRANEVWKTQITQPIINRSGKFEKIFSESEQQYILDRLVSLDSLNTDVP